MQQQERSRSQPSGLRCEWVIAPSFHLISETGPGPLLGAASWLNSASGHPARSPGDLRSGIAHHERGRGTWVSSPDALTETAAERRLLSPSAEIALAHFYPRQLVELSGFSRFERSAGSTGDSSSEADGGLP